MIVNETKIIEVNYKSNINTRPLKFRRFLFVFKKFQYSITPLKLIRKQAT